MWLFGFLCTSLGILIGGTIAWLFKGLQQKIDLVYGICAGIILGLISIEIFPEAIELGGWLITIVGFTVGMILFGLLHNVLHYIQVFKKTSNIYIRSGLLLLISFAVHNLPMGITLGASQEKEFTISLLQTLLFHSIPEGIILFTPLIMAGINVFLGFLITLIISSPVLLGVYIGGVLGFNHQYFSASLISITIGIILMVTVSEILYPALLKSSPLKIITFTLIGFGIIGLYIKLF
ncbi:ZIP family metal transporter [Lysinibacillus telephonicus]|uniref:Divalent cation transporter n=1 Tax=Lysinibacillus telephonicus TaxID=1714840 RepID=A0A431UG25_9BACI|nr:ZIP family metal transporter [Lysinibacillus telephonicus]RTQ88528.1 divalent cation transporter [Lysinibacillus telephonicus]